ncbi:MAG: transmembrane anchor protein, partial [Gemmatimonas sp.]
QLAREAASSATTTPPIAADSAARATPPTAGATTPSAAAAAVAADSTRRDSVQVVLRPNEAKEIKLIMVKGARVNFSWTLDKGAVGFETHGDTLNAPRGVFHSYGKGRDSTYDKGSFVAVFNGMHGWFWRNRTSKTVTVTLRTDGQYSELKRMP